MTSKFAEQVKATELPTPVNAADWLDTEQNRQRQIRFLLTPLTSVTK